MGLAQLFDAARGMIGPDDPLTHPGLVRHPGPAAPLPPIEPTLHVIRNPHVQQTDIPPLPRNGAALALLVLLTPFARPVAAAQALIVHLNGGDLRDWPWMQKPLC